MRCDHPLTRWTNAQPVTTQPLALTVSVATSRGKLEFGPDFYEIRKVVRILLLCVLSLAATRSSAEEETAVSYEEQIKPIFRNHCLGCHNSDAKKGDLALDSYGGTMEGGASGEVVYAGELESSRLWDLVNHDDSPEMPPSADKMPAAELALIRRWIEEGAAERAGSRKQVPKKSKTSFQPTPLDDSTPGAMPEKMLRQPVVTVTRSAAVTAMATSPRAPLVALGGQRQVACYHTQTLELLGIVPYPEGMPVAIRFSRDGNLLIIAGGKAAHAGSVAIHDVRTGRRVAKLADEVDAILTADIDVGLEYLAIGGTTKSAKIFSVATGELRFTIKKHTDWVTAVEFSPDGKWLATADRAGGLMIWEAATAREYQVMQGHTGMITGLSWRSDSRVLATASEDGNIRLWDPEKVAPIRSWNDGGAGVTSLQMGRDGSLVTAGRNRTVKKWDGSGKIQFEFSPLGDIALSAVITSDSQRVLGGDWTGRVAVWDVGNQAPRGELAANPPTLEQRLENELAKLAERERAVVESQAALTAAETELAAAEAAWQTARTASRQIQQQADQVAERMQSISTRLEQSTDDHSQQEFEGQTAKLLEEVAALEGELSKFASGALQAMRRVDASRRPVAARGQAYEQAAEQLKLHREQIGQLREEIAAFNGLSSQWEQDAVTSDSRAQRVQAEIEDAAKQLAALQQSYQVREGELEAELQAAEEAAAAAREQLEWFRACYDAP